jgi:hypothetical protein
MMRSREEGPKDGKCDSKGSGEVLWAHELGLRGAGKLLFLNALFLWEVRWKF